MRTVTERLRYAHVELPSTGAAPELIAPLDTGLRAIFTGLDLRGWKTNAATSARWRVSGERLNLRQGSSDPAATLYTAKEFADVEFVLDCLPAKPAAGSVAPTIEIRGAILKLEDAAPGNYQRYEITVRGRNVIVKRNGTKIQNFTLPTDAPARGPFGIRDTGAAIEFINLYAREL